MTRKNYNRHIQSLKHKKNERMYNRNKLIESANEAGIKINNEDIEQKLDEQYTQSGYTNIEEGMNFLIVVICILIIILLIINM